MPRITDKEAIRSILNTDRLWAAYALGDLAPGFYEHSEWYGVPSDPTALALTPLIRVFELPVLFLMGQPASVRLLLDEIGTQARVFFLARPEIMPDFLQRYQIEKLETMWRMSLEAEEFDFVPPVSVHRLGTGDLEALQALFADGDTTREAPDFFMPEMLAKGVYFGVREGKALVAAAGTHLVEPSEGVGAIGNVYTRRDRRGRGLATQVTGAVTAELVRRLTTIVLNVNIENVAAQRVYERLGFRPHCRFQAGVAVAK